MLKNKLFLKKNTPELIVRNVWIDGLISLTKQLSHGESIFWKNFKNCSTKVKIQTHILVLHHCIRHFYETNIFYRHIFIKVI